MCIHVSVLHRPVKRRLSLFDSIDIRRLNSYRLSPVPGHRLISNFVELYLTCNLLPLFPHSHASGYNIRMAIALPNVVYVFFFFSLFCSPPIASIKRELVKAAPYQLNRPYGPPLLTILCVGQCEI